MGNNIKIKWMKERDRHIVGLCLLGKVMIRVDRDRKVTGMYTFFNGTEKWMPSDEHEEAIAGAQLRMELLAEEVDREERIKYLTTE